MKVLYQTGYAIAKDVEVVINSANGLLNADSTGAGAIRQASAELSLAKKKEFDTLFTQAPKDIQEFFEFKRKKHVWEYRYENLSCLKLLRANDYNSFPIGTAVHDILWSPNETKTLIHAITLTYNPLTGERIVGTPKQISNALTKAITLAIRLGKKSIALPVPCAREEYGIGPEKAFRIVSKVIEKFDSKDITIIICFDNQHTAQYLEKNIPKYTNV